MENEENAKQKIANQIQQHIKMMIIVSFLKACKVGSSYENQTMWFTMVSIMITSKDVVKAYNKIQNLFIKIFSKIIKEVNNLIKKIYNKWQQSLYLMVKYWKLSHWDQARAGMPVSLFLFNVLL